MSCVFNILKMFCINWLHPPSRLRCNYIERSSPKTALDCYCWFILRPQPHWLAPWECCARWVSEWEQLPVRGNQDYLPSQIIHELYLRTSFLCHLLHPLCDPVCKPLLSPRCSSLPVFASSIWHLTQVGVGKNMLRSFLHVLLCSSCLKSASDHEEVATDAFHHRQLAKFSWNHYSISQLLREANSSIIKSRDHSQGPSLV